VKVTFAVPSAAVAAAARLTVFATPGVRVEVAGVIVTPAGKPLSATDTVPAKPFVPIAVSCTEMDAPGLTDELAGLTVNE
jgi:hypothetical protein